MAIGPERMAYMMKMLRSSIAEYYGDAVPDMKTFKNRRRKTFMDALELEVDAPLWRQRIADAENRRRIKQGVTTRLKNEQYSKEIEMSAKHTQELAELKAKQEREKSELVAHYEPSLLEAKADLDQAERDLASIKRKSYFAGLCAEDDNRQIYGNFTVEEAILLRVDEYIERNLASDSEGRAVEIRLKQESLVSDLAFIAEKLPELRSLLLAFIKAGKLPPITVESWLIEKGKDLTEENEPV